VPDNNEYFEANRRHWDEVTPIHIASKFYDVDSFRAGKSTLLPIELEEVGDVAGKTMLHLQCHFGMDTLSWARKGARITGVDFSPAAIAAARGLAADLGIAARFIESNVYSVPEVLDEQFDIVFVSYGALVWLPDIVGWARVCARYVKPGGFLYLLDGHPAQSTFWDSESAYALRISHDYFQEGATREEYDGTYAERRALIENRVTYEFTHPLGATVTAVTESGLSIEFLHEFPCAAWEAVPGLEHKDDGYWWVPPDAPQVPLMFSLRARRP
jgi:ubiquinone/menaquinone biosynthesis C-methylase UbiE